MAQHLDKGKINSELMLRVMSSLVLGPLVLLVIYFGSFYFQILVIIGTIILTIEWWHMTNKKAIWLFLGLFYIGAGCISLILIRNSSLMGQETTIWLFIIIWATDIGAYFSGKMLGGPKLAPMISPQKTWAGLVGGMAFAALASILVNYFINIENLLGLIIISSFLGAVCQSGDLLESYAKRYFNVKNSGKILPGHGGLLDRVDGLLAASLLVAGFQWVKGKGILEWF